MCTAQPVPNESYEPDAEASAVLDVLKREGKANPLLIREETDLRKQYVNGALRDLVNAGWIEKRVQGLYEFRADPRDGNEHSFGTETARRTLEQIRAERDALEEELADCRQRLDAAGHVDRPALRRALADAEVAAERGDGEELRDALGRAREVVSDAK